MLNAAAAAAAVRASDSPEGKRRGSPARAPLPLPLGTSPAPGKGENRSPPAAGFAALACDPVYSGVKKNILVLVFSEIVWLCFRMEEGVLPESFPSRSTQYSK